MSRFLTSSALSSMNLRRGSTWSPISVVNIRSASVWSSAFTCSSVRLRRIHRRLPQRVRVHLAKALVAIDRDALLAGGDEELDEIVERFDLTSTSSFAPASRHGAGLPAVLRLRRELGRLVERRTADGRLVRRRPAASRRPASSASSLAAVLTIIGPLMSLTSW